MRKGRIGNLGNYTLLNLDYSYVTATMKHIKKNLFSQAAVDFLLFFAYISETKHGSNYFLLS